MIVMKNEGCDGKWEGKRLLLCRASLYSGYMDRAVKVDEGVAMNKLARVLIATGAQISINFKLLLYQAEVLTFQ